MSKENGFFCENAEHGHISETDAVECYGRGKIAELQQLLTKIADRAEQEDSALYVDMISMICSQD